MNKEQEQLLYKIADTFKTDLFLVGKDIRGLVADHQLDVAGAWQLKTDVTVIVDESTEKLVSALTRMVDGLWAYAVSTTDGIWLLFFDGDRVKLKPGKEKELGLGSAKATLSKIKSSVTRAFFRKSGSGAVWEPVDPKELVG